jgi:phospholipase/carboxylesterase
MSDPHRDTSIVTAGLPLDEARSAMVLVHGRGATAESILTLVPELTAGGAAEGFAFLAPQAAGNTWYPYSFLAEIESNEPYLSSALAALGRLLARVGEAGVPPERTVLLGFSQGACLSLEYAARHARRYGGVAGLTGGLIGPPGSLDSFEDRYSGSGAGGSLDGTPILVASGDPDPHVPRRRVEESAAILSRLGAAVDLRFYPGMGHTINQDELERVRAMMHAAAVSGGGAGGAG